MGLEGFVSSASDTPAAVTSINLTATATKTSLENKHLRNDDYLVIFASSSHPLFLTEHSGLDW